MYIAAYYDFTKPSFYFTTPKVGLRGASTTVNCIMQSDMQSIKTGNEKLENLIIPMTMNSKLDFKTLELYKHAFIIPEKFIQYKEIEGAKWQN